MGDWYYIGHYGQLGPLSREQIDDLIRDGVIARDTYVWKSGMSDWITADRTPELAALFAVSVPPAVPPPPPGPREQQVFVPAPPTPQSDFLSTPNYQYPTFGMVRSDRSRTAAGFLQLVLPGVGRMYLGYTAYGVLQLFLALCGVGFLWSFIDGIIILTGGVKLDGYGRHLQD